MAAPTNGVISSYRGRHYRLQYIWQNSGAVLGPNGSVRLDEPAALEAVTFMAGLIQAARGQSQP